MTYTSFQSQVHQSPYLSQTAKSAEYALLVVATGVQQLVV